MPKATQGRKNSDSSHHWTLKTSRGTGQGWPHQHHPACRSAQPAPPPRRRVHTLQGEGGPGHMAPAPTLSEPVLECGLSQMTSPL